MVVNRNCSWESPKTGNTTLKLEIKHFKYAQTKEPKSTELKESLIMMSHQIEISNRDRNYKESNEIANMWLKSTTKI